MHISHHYLKPPNMQLMWKTLIIENLYFLSKAVLWWQNRHETEVLYYLQENIQKMYSQYHVNIYSGNGRWNSSGNSTARNIKQHRLQGRLCYQRITYLICIDRLIRVAVYKPAEQTAFLLHVMPAGCGGWYTRPWHHRRRLVTTTSNTLLSRESPATSRRRCEGKPYSIKHGVSCEGIVDGSLGVFITRPITSL